MFCDTVVSIRVIETAQIHVHVGTRFWHTLPCPCSVKQQAPWRDGDDDDADYADDAAADDDDGDGDDNDHGNDDDDAMITQKQ